MGFGLPSGAEGLAEDGEGFPEGRESLAEDEDGLAEAFSVHRSASAVEGRLTFPEETAKGVEDS